MKIEWNTELGPDGVKDKIAALATELWPIFEEKHKQHGYDVTFLTMLVILSSYILRHSESEELLINSLDFGADYFSQIAQAIEEGEGMTMQ